MKTLFSFILLIFLTESVCSQVTINKLFGAHNNGTSNVFSSLDLPSFSYSQISTLSGSTNPSAGETTYDAQNNRYFVKSGSSIFAIDALSGYVLDTIKNASEFYNMEYDLIANALVGFWMSGTSITFKAYSLTGGFFYTLNTITTIDSIVKGESTFDQANRKYFTMTNLGMVVINSSGVLTDVLCASPNLNGIEYNRTNNRIYYLEWNGAEFDFTSIDATTCSTGYICLLPSDTLAFKGESTFDWALGYYYSRTNLGLVQIDINAGIVTHHPASNNFLQMEFATLIPTGLLRNTSKKKTNVFPNPSNHLFNFTDLKIGSSIDVYNANGQLILHEVITETKLTLDFEKEVKGIYFYRVYNPSGESEHGKLMLR
jgi:hypothetical protein